MKFGPVPLSQAEGAILAHSLHAGGRRIRKGAVLDVAALEALGAAGHASVVVARMEPGDLHEDAAAEALATALASGPGISLSTAFTGRVNLIAEGPGVVQLDAAAIDAANMVHPMITVATVPQMQQMALKGLIATVKIIAYGVPGEAVARAAEAARGAVRMAAPKMQTASLIITDIPGGPGSKGEAAIRGRVEALGLSLKETALVPHEEGALSAALNAATGEVILILTASATSDVMDTGPAALTLAGGRVERFGMPVDPGNLLFLGHLGAQAVIGLPGCARAPALNGADWVLARAVCGIEVTGADIAGMGVGGLLKEIPTRPMPRRGRSGVA
ncbi:molybdopterin-binding protein [Roseovarius sp. LXJ103]|uniref:molybdopterin-binding protein n=1 Tax=Roseovarius carneus TaxID=2853164 RepID=UPI000D61FC1B|nr:molybdopterin-binding protein [Roseovarius carneus]MBZ8119326.1 molybdopterin-binding protein [Roseovarius carneus]PWE35062.1 molybdopterin biosynthesis protein [Pelagicola sp. LXJ1103]